MKQPAGQKDFARMQSNSLQAIADFYERRGLKGKALLKALEKDREYQQLLEQRKKKLVTRKKDGKQMQGMVLSTKADFEILEKCIALEGKKLSAEDKRMVRLAKMQLLENWRPTLLKELRRLAKKYGT